MDYLCEIILKFILDLFRNSLGLKKSGIFAQICEKILRAYGDIRSKNFVVKMPKRTILATQASFERGLLLNMNEKGSRKESPSDDPKSNAIFDKWYKISCVFKSFPSKG